MAPRKLLARGANWVLVARERPSEYERSILGTVEAASSVHELVRDRILREPGEVMYAIALDGRNRVIAMCEVSRGGLHACAVTARDVLRPMVACGASSFILVHNHPSGDPTASPEDVKFTRVVRAAAEVVGTPLVDHVIVGSWERYFSFHDRDMLD